MMMMNVNDTYNRKVLNDKYLGRFKKKEFKEGEAKPRNKFHRQGGLWMRPFSKDKGRNVFTRFSSRRKFLWSRICG